MIIPGNKQVVCITGNVWTGSRNAPRKLLVKDGYQRPTWFTTGRRVTDAEYVYVSNTDFHLSVASERVLAHMEFGGATVGILKLELEKILEASPRGALVVGPQEIAARVADAIPQAIVFSLKDEMMELSPHLDDADKRGQVHRVDVDVLEPGAWSEVHIYMADKLGFTLDKLGSE